MMIDNGCKQYLRTVHHGDWKPTSTMYITMISVIIVGIFVINKLVNKQLNNGHSILYNHHGWYLCIKTGFDIV